MLKAKYEKAFRDRGSRFASEEGGIRETGTDEKCFYIYEHENFFYEICLKLFQVKKTLGHKFFAT